MFAPCRKLRKPSRMKSWATAWYKLLLSRLEANIATHNDREEFDFPIRSSTMENTCSGTFLKHYEFTGSFEAIWRTVGSLSGFDP